MRHPSTRNPRLHFDSYDAGKLIEALNILRRVYDFNYDSSRKVRLLETVMDKLHKLICDHCCEEDLPRGFIDS
jgi:hypothetical protein